LFQNILSLKYVLSRAKPGKSYCHQNMSDAVSLGVMATIKSSEIGYKKTILI